MKSNFNNIISLQNENKSCQYYTIRDFLSAFSTCANNSKKFGDNENSSSTETAINNVTNSNIVCLCLFPNNHKMQYNT